MFIGTSYSGRLDLILKETHKEKDLCIWAPLGATILIFEHMECRGSQQKPVLLNFDKTARRLDAPIKAYCFVSFSGTPKGGKHNPERLLKICVEPHFPQQLAWTL